MICSECEQIVRCGVCGEVASKPAWIRGIKIFRCVLCHDSNIVPFDVMVGVCCEIGMKAAFEEFEEEITATEDYYSEDSHRLSISDVVESNYQEHARMRGESA